MNTQNTPPKHVQVLPESVARRIAAGEVIDRPHAAVRELLDNAIDALSSEITVHLEGGGVDLIQVRDDGSGMSRADLDICWMPHATSKITSVDDLERVNTLGFRGEALSSLAACARLEIISSRNGESFRLSVEGGSSKELSAHHGAPGTTVSVRDLFFNMPARRKFLKSTRAESGLCRKVFLEKAAAHPAIAFRLFVDGVLKSFFPAQTPSERVAAAWPRLAPGQPWWETSAEGEGFSILTVHQRPEVFRKDRQYIQIYANRRRIDEFSLVQAVQYAYDAWMPGGHFPAAFVFIEIHPSLVDFNIHPAKKEARFRDMPALRHGLVESLKDRLSAESYKIRASGKTLLPVQGNLRLSSSSPQAEAPRPFSGRPAAAPPAESSAPSSASPPESSAPRSNSRNYTRGHSREYGRNLSAQFKAYPAAEESASFARAVSEINRQKREELPPAAARETASAAQETASAARETAPAEPAQNFRYLGQIMGVFLLAERGNTLYIVDQHAAHERVLFDRFRKAPPKPEKLLFPRPLDLDRQALMRLELRQERLAAMGIEVEKDSEGQWQLTALPHAAGGMEETIALFIESGSADAESLEKELWADISCKAAIKDNHVLDRHGAEQLLRDTFTLEFPRCPHGRPVWFEISRQELFELVGRTV